MTAEHIHEHCWHSHGGWASTTGASETNFHCCFCGETKVVRTEATTAPPTTHGPYLNWAGGYP